MKTLNFQEVNDLVDEIEEGGRPSLTGIQLTEHAKNQIKVVIDFTIKEDLEWYYDVVEGKVIEGEDDEKEVELMSVSKSYWEKQHKYEEEVYGKGGKPVKFLRDKETGQLVIVTKGEYSDALVEFVEGLGVIKPKERMTQMEALLGMVNGNKDVRMYNQLIELKKAKGGGHLTMGIDAGGFGDMCESVMLNNKGKKRKHFAIAFVVNEDELLETIKKG